jgi:hypothetical protein
VLVPVLIGVNALLLGVLRVLDRLPAAGWGVYTSLFVTLLAEAVAALALGLLASSAVSNAAQAALALPMLCFPQVLFAGAVVPVGDMAAPGLLLSLSLINRFSFEALGRGLRLDQLTGTVPALRGYGDTFAGTVAYRWLVLAGFALGAGLPHADADETVQRPGDLGFAVSCPPHRGSAGRRAVARQVRIASRHRPAGGWRQRRLLRPVPGGHTVAASWGFSLVARSSRRSRSNHSPRLWAIMPCSVITSSRRLGAPGARATVRAA